jgi:RNA polymerase sigma-70 factor (ECF subfamily)
MGVVALGEEGLHVATDAVGSEPAQLEFEEFYRAEFPGLVVLATAVLGRRAGAEDVAQDAMLDAHRRWDRLSGYDAPRAWVRTVVVQRSSKVSRKGRNESLAQLRAAQGRVSTVSEPADLDPEVTAALRSLPTQQRAALALHYLYDCSLAEIAQTLGVAEGTIKTHLQRGRRHLAERLSPSGDQTPSDDRGSAAHD